MGKRPNLSGMKKYFVKGNDFCINRDQYIKITGIDIPQGKSYTENKSAVAKMADQYGYKVKVIPEKLEFIKV